MQQQVFINDMRANFNLRRPKGDKPTNIYFVVRVGKRQLKLSTGVKVYPDHWNVRKQEAYISVRLSELDNLNNTIVNDKLEELKMNFAEYKQYLCDHPSELDRGVELLKKYVYKNNIMESQGLVLNPISWLEENIKEDANLTNTGRNSTKNQYLSYLKKFSRFLEVKGIEIKTFEEINSKLLSSFRDYLANDYVFIKKGKETHLKRDYINSLIIILITILKRAVEAGLLENHKYVDLLHHYLLFNDHLDKPLRWDFGNLLGKWTPKKHLLINKLLDMDSKDWAAIMPGQLTAVGVYMRAYLQERIDQGKEFAIREDDGSFMVVTGVKIPDGWE